MIYTDKEKQIYSSPVGTLHDPIGVFNFLTFYSEGKFNSWLNAFFQPESDVERAGAALKLVEVARAAFGLQPLTETGGHGDGVVLEVIEHFTEYLSKKE
jgi:hypothetical protein